MSIKTRHLTDKPKVLFGDLASQLKVFERYCTLAKPSLLAAIRSRNLQQVALLYNGPRYRRNRYDTKLDNTLDDLERV